MNMRLLAILFLAVSPGTHAQGTLNAWETFAERLEGTKTISGQGDDILGDRVNLSNGSLSFQVTDVDLPGNDGLPVRITRNYVLSNGFTNLEGMMVDWEIDLPYINGQTTSGWEVGYPATGNRCTSDGVPEVPYPFTLAEVWQGIVMNMPGYQGELLRTLPATTRPGDGPTYRWTGGDQIHVSCLPTTKNGSGEGFLARAPDGTRYWFDWMAQKGREGVKRVEVRGVGQPNVTHHLVRRNNFLYVSRIEDRFGNYVNFTYSNAWNQPARLTAITASDGRALTLSYSNNR
ncbi:MAG TPA: hypothetical protein PLK29_09980, partial [Chiayiivirga sp.]|nr:hypothetical protein [Chiayiivirga sp.]